MIINFVVPFVEKTGGIQVVFTYANELQKRGHDVKIYYPFFPYPMSYTGIRYIEKFMKTMFNGFFRHRWRVEWFNLLAPLKLVPVINKHTIRDADAIIATAWPTAYDISLLPKNKGTKFYFIQHYEIWSGEKEKVDNSYKLELNQIVIAKWLRDLMIDRFNRKNVFICHNGINLSEFFPDRLYKKQKHRFEILLLAHPVELKGMKDGIRVVNYLKENGYDVGLKLFGMGKCDGIPDYAELYINPSKDELRRLYSNSDVYLFPSWQEGWGLTVIEAMACKCAVVGNEVGCLLDIGKNGYNCMLSKPHDVSTMVKNIIELIDDLSKLEEIRNNGYNTVQAMSWEKSFDKFERIIEENA